MHIESVFSSSIEVRNSSPQGITHHRASSQKDTYLVFDGTSACLVLKGYIQGRRVRTNETSNVSCGWKRIRAMEVEVEYLGRSHSRKRVREKVSSVGHHRVLARRMSRPYLNEQ